MSCKKLFVMAKLKLTIKLFATISLKTGLKVVDVNIDKPVNVEEMLKIVSDIIDYDLVKELVENKQIDPGMVILLNKEDINEVADLTTMITGDTVISICPKE